MSANITLKQADFSANNIGRFVTYDDITLAVLAKQTQYAQGSAEADALNTFIVGLKEAGLLGVDNAPIKSLFIPALAASHDELAYNIAQFDNGYPTNEMPSAEAQDQSTPVFVRILDSSNRCVGVLFDYIADNDDYSARTRFDNHLGIPASGSFPAVSSFAYNLTDLKNPTSATPFKILEIGGGSYVLKIDNLYIGTSYSGSRHGYNFDGENDTLKGFLGASVQEGGLDFDKYADNGNFTGTGLPMSSALPVPTENRDKMIVSQRSQLAAAKTRLAMFGCATYLSASEMATFRSLVAALMTALHVAAYIA